MIGSDAFMFVVSDLGGLVIGKLSANCVLSSLLSLLNVGGLIVVRGHLVGEMGERHGK